MWSCVFLVLQSSAVDTSATSSDGCLCPLLRDTCNAATADQEVAEAANDTSQVMHGFGFLSRAAPGRLSDDRKKALRSPRVPVACGVNWPEDDSGVDHCGDIRLPSLRLSRPGNTRPLLLPVAPPNNPPRSAARSAPAQGATLPSPMVCNLPDSTSESKGGHHLCRVCDDPNTDWICHVMQSIAEASEALTLVVDPSAHDIHKVKSSRDKFLADNVGVGCRDVYLHGTRTCRTDIPAKLARVAKPCGQSNAAWFSVHTFADGDERSHPRCPLR